MVILVAVCVQCKGQIRYQSVQVQSQFVRGACPACKTENLLPSRPPPQDTAVTQAMANLDAGLEMKETAISAFQMAADKRAVAAAVVQSNVHGAVAHVANGALNVIGGLSHCLGVIKAVFSVLEAINKMYKNVKANNEKCKTLYERLSGMAPPLDRLNSSLLEQRQRVETGRSSMDDRQIASLLDLLNKIKDVFERSLQLIQDWTELGTKFFGKLRQALNSSKFSDDFDEIRKTLKECLQDLTTNVVIQMFANSIAPEIQRTYGQQIKGWDAKDKEDNEKDLKMLPQQIDRVVDNDGAKLEQLVKASGWDVRQLEQKFQQHNLAISNTMKSVISRLDQVMQKQDKVLEKTDDINQQLAEVKNLLVQLQARKVEGPAQPVASSSAWKNPKAGQFWDSVILAKFPGTKSLEFKLFSSALFIGLLDCVEVNPADYNKIIPNLQLIFDFNRDGSVDVFEFDQATASETPLEICQRLLKSQSHTPQTAKFLAIPAANLNEVVSGGPQYPTVSAARAALIASLAGNLRRTSLDPRVLHAFQCVPRSMFLPANVNREDIYKDTPLQIGVVHQSAPSMYALCMEFMNISVDNKVGRFLCIGSGTGYFNAMVAVMQQWMGVNHGLEVNPELVNFSNQNIKKFSEACHIKSNIQIFQGNCFTTQNQNQYDCIYVGAACLKEWLPKLQGLIADGGRMLLPLGPAGHQEFVLVQRQAKAYTMKTLSKVNFKELVLPDAHLSHAMGGLSLSQQTPQAQQSPHHRRP